MTYDTDFYRLHQEGTRRSARAVLPLVKDLVHPLAVVDVGCGLGSWLAAFAELGVVDGWGVDGDHVPRNALEIPVDRFTARDLSQPFEIGCKFDLAICLEVAEHLPAESAEGFIASLAKLAPVILFSAAIPGQGGEQHVNEQWPDYWAEIFAIHDFLPIDCIRKRVWNDSRVEWWYQQNLLLYANSDHLSAHPSLKREFDCAGTRQLSLVHPVKWGYMLEWAEGLYRNGESHPGPV